MNRLNLVLSVALASICFASPESTRAAVVKVSEAAFVAGSGQITFSEFPLGTTNPTYLPATYGGGATSPTVTFGGFFTGQSLGTPATCPPGAAVTGCVVGNPTGPLSLAPGSPASFIANDAAHSTTPVLSGTPLFNGPIAVLFSDLQSGVGLSGGGFNAIGSTAITAYGANGEVLGSVLNTVDVNTAPNGIEFLGLVTDNGAALIMGLLFHLVGSEPAGFTIDNVRFGVGTQVVVPPSAVPLPAALPMFVAGLGLGGVILRRRRKAA